MGIVFNTQLLFSPLYALGIDFDTRLFEVVSILILNPQSSTHHRYNSIYHYAGERREDNHQDWVYLAVGAKEAGGKEYP